jgi:hypothetical protein
MYNSHMVNVMERLFHENGHSLPEKTEELTETTEE